MCVCAVGFGVSRFKLVVVNSTDSGDMKYLVFCKEVLLVHVLYSINTDIYNPESEKSADRVQLM